MESSKSNKTGSFVRSSRVLVVENDPDTLELLLFALSRIGLTGIQYARDGYDAIQILKTEVFGLILCDWNMPRMSGMELLRAKKELPKGSRTPFIFITAEASKEKVLEACKEGATDYIVKPWNLDVLSSKVKKYIDIQ